MATPEDIEEQLKLLEAHRRTLRVYLQQQAQLSLLTPPGVINGIEDAREKIRHVKQALRNWGVVVEDHPSDEPYRPPPPQPRVQQSYSNTSPPRPSTTAQATPPISVTPSEHPDYVFKIAWRVLSSYSMSGVMLVLIGTYSLYRAASGRSSGSAGIAIVIGLLGLLFAGLIFRWVYRSRNDKISIRQSGVAKLEKGEFIFIPWDDLATISKNIRPEASATSGEITGFSGYILNSKTGEKMVISRWYDDIKEFEKILFNRFMQRELRRFREQLNLSGKVRFQKIILNRMGIRLEEATIPWHLVRKVDVQKGRIIVRRSDKKEIQTIGIVGDIPNYFVMVALANEMAEKN